MNLTYTNYLESYCDLGTEISYIIENEISNYMYLRLEIIVYIKNDNPITLNITSFYNPIKVLENKIYSYIDIFENIYEITDMDIQGCLINFYKL